MHEKAPESAHGQFLSERVKKKNNNKIKNKMTKTQTEELLSAL